MGRLPGSSLIAKSTAACGLALIALDVAACGATKDMPTLGGENGAQVKGGRAVFGRISVIWRKGPRTWKGFTCQEVLTFDCPDVFRVYVFAKNAIAPFQHMPSGDGSFTWVLRPGEYTLAAYQLENWKKSRSPRFFSGRIAGRFVVPPGRPGVYLGTTRIFLSGSRFGVEIKDEIESAGPAFRNTKGAPAGTPYRSLAVLETIPSGEKTVRICAPLWGVECTREFRGVRPLFPKVERDDFVVAPSIGPTLEWTPSSDPDVSYDIVMFKALPLNPGRMKSRWVAGPIVEYASAFRTARYTPQKRLKPKTNYYWSVRMRKDDTVSSWSTVSYRYFAFLVVASVMGRGSGIYFNFGTP